MAYISFQPSDYFNTTIYTGNSTNDTDITGVGFNPDLVWIKDRDASENHWLQDNVRGILHDISSNETAPQVQNNFVSETISNGFTLSNSQEVNETGQDYVSWNWKAGTTSGISGGTITPSAYSFNTTSGFSAVAYTGTGANATVPHGLGAIPKMIIVKSLNLTANWMVYHSGIATDAETDYLNLNNTNAAGDNNTIWNDTAPTSSVFSVGSNTDVNGSGSTYIAYCFADVKGYSKFGGYTGNGSSTAGAFIYTGFRPAFIVIKRTNSATSASWFMFDNKINTYNPLTKYLVANTTAAEAGDSGNSIDLLSNGFKFYTNGNSYNASGSTYIYMAFAEFPIVSSNDTPGVAR